METKACVRCADCGFLTLRNATDRSLDEVELGLRESWDMPAKHSMSAVGKSTAHALYSKKPMCLMMVLEHDPSFDPDNKDTALAIIKKERQCDKFTPWKQGFTPKEHLEMLMSLDAIKLQTESQERMRKEDQAFQLKMLDISNAFQTEQHNLNRKAQIDSAWRSALISAIIGAIVAFIGIYIQYQIKAQ